MLALELCRLGSSDEALVRGAKTINQAIREEIPAMTSRLMLAAALVGLAATGCNNPAARLVGKWDVDFGQVQSQIEGSGNPLAAMAAGMMSMFKMQAEFKADGVLNMSISALGQSKSVAGRWRYLKNEGEVLVLMVQMEKEAREQELRVHFTDRDHFEMVPPVSADGGEKRALPFVRQAG
jgi:hypothetical protein